MKDNTFNKDNPDKNAFIPSIKNQQQHYYQSKLLQVKDYNETFELVKSTVDKKFKMHRLD